MNEVDRELPLPYEPEPAPAEAEAEHEHAEDPPTEPLALPDLPPAEPLVLPDLPPPTISVQPAPTPRLRISIRPRGQAAPTTPAFTPVDLGPGFTPVDLGPGFTPVDLGPGFTPVDVGPGFTPVDLGPGFTPVEASPAFTPIQPAPRSAPVSRRQVRVTAQPHAPGTAPAGRGGRDVRARVREAMRCPFCRDDVAQAGAVGCARRGCGALYHAECWSECSSSYGGCAVFGCGSRVATGVSRTAFLMRLVRLAFAAFLFPTRVIEAIRQEGEGVAAMRRALRSEADRSHHVMWTKDRPGARTGAARFWTYATKLLMLAVAYSIVGWILVQFPSQNINPLKIILLLLGVPLAMTLGLYFATWPVALGLHWARAIFEGEFSALARAAIGGTVMDRMRLPGGKKPG